MAAYVAATLGIREPSDFRIVELGLDRWACSIAVGTGSVLLSAAAADALAFALTARQVTAEIDARSAAYHEQQVEDAIDRLHDGMGNHD